MRYKQEMDYIGITLDSKLNWNAGFIKTTNKRKETLITSGDEAHSAV